MTVSQTMSGTVRSEKQASWTWVVISCLVLFCSINMFTCVVTSVMNPEGAEGHVLPQTLVGVVLVGVQGTSCDPESTNPQLFRASLATAVGRFEVSPISSWPLSEDCVSSL